jgi:hypothetical protein
VPVLLERMRPRQIAEAVQRKDSSALMTEDALLQNWGVVVERQVLSWASYIGSKSVELPKILFVRLKGAQSSCLSCEQLRAAQLDVVKILSALNDGLVGGRPGCGCSCGFPDIRVSVRFR